jgi:hypothetical protein
MDAVFEIGQTVVAACDYAHQVVEGRRYRVVGYQPKCPTPNFTWPAYVTVIGDNGGKVTAHTHRFRALKEGE